MNSVGCTSRRTSNRKPKVKIPTHVLDALRDELVDVRQEHGEGELSIACVKDMLEVIRTHLTPAQVFETNELKEWAEDNGFEELD